SDAVGAPLQRARAGPNLGQGGRIERAHLDELERLLVGVERARPTDADATDARCVVLELVGVGLIAIELIDDSHVVVAAGRHARPGTRLEHPTPIGPAHLRSPALRVAAVAVA